MRLLVVEDEPHLRFRLAQTLRQRGYSVDEAVDGKEGLHKAQDWPYDAIILDVMLPEMDGWTVLEALRQAGRKTPVLLLTARDAIADRVKGLNSGADDYLVKPFDFDELFARIAALIRRSSGEPSPLTTIGDVMVDTASQTVKRANITIVMTAREYSLLEIMLAKRGQVVSRSYLFDHLCDEFDSPTSNVVDVHVCNLRKKLGHNFIHTVRGRGYLLPENADLLYH